MRLPTCHLDPPDVKWSGQLCFHRNPPSHCLVRLWSSRGNNSWPSCFHVKGRDSLSWNEIPTAAQLSPSGTGSAAMWVWWLIIMREIEWFRAALVFGGTPTLLCTCRATAYRLAITVRTFLQNYFCFYVSSLLISATTVSRSWVFSLIKSPLIMTTNSSWQITACIQSRFGTNDQTYRSVTIQIFCVLKSV